MEIEEISRSVFQQISQADLMAKDMPAKVIVMIGLSRCGKSTSFNWQVNPRWLRGKRIGLNYYYHLDSSDRNSAIIDHKLESVTIQPNLAALSDGNYLMDMAGLGDRRDPSKILVVNYTQMAILRSLKEAKFLLVVTEAGLKDIANNGFVITIQEFLSLFKLDELSEDEKIGFFESVSLLVTSATEEDKRAYVQQLSILGSHMQELNQKNPLAIKHFPQVKDLIEILVRNARVQVFPRAKPNELPAPSQLIPILNAKKWNYFNFQRRNIFQSSFLQQIYNLKQQSEQTKLQNIIDWRFKLTYRLRDIIGQLLDEHINSIARAEVNLSDSIDLLVKEFLEQPLYNNVPDFEQQDKDRNMLYLPQRIQIISLIDETGKQIKQKSSWEQTYQSSSPEQYFTYLKKIFLEQMNLVYKLLGFSRQYRIVIKKVEWIFSHIFDEASVMIYMNQLFGAILKVNLKEAISWSNAIDISKNKLLFTFVQSFGQNIQNDTLDKFNSRQIEEIVEFLTKIDQENIDATHIYKIIIKLRLTQASIVKETRQISRVQKMKAITQCLHNALTNVLKITSCFMAVKTNEETKLELINDQKDVLKSIAYILSTQGLFTEATKIAQILKQYSLKGSILQEKAKKEGRQAWKDLAEYYVKIGDCQQATKAYNRVGGQLATQKIKEIEIDSSRLLKINGDLIKQEESSLLNLENGEEVLRILENINKNIKPFDQKFLQIAQIYKKRIQKYFMDEDQLAYPRDPSNYQLITLTQPLLSLIENKRIIIVLSPLPKSGKTLIIGGSSGKRLISHDGITFDLLEGPAGKVNHGGSSSLFPTISVQPNGESLIEFPHLFQHDPLRQLFLVNLLQKMLKVSQSFKFLIVSREQHITQNSAIQFLRLLMFIRRVLCFKETNSKDSFEQNIKLLRTVSLIVTNVDKKPMLLKKLVELRSSLSSNDRKVVVENEKRLGLKEAHQWQVYHMIWNIMHQGRLECLNKPQREKFTLPKLNIIQLLSDNTHANKDWLSGNGEMVLNASRLMLSDLLESQRTAIKLDCEAKISKLNDISKIVADLATYNYKKIIYAGNQKPVPFSALTEIVDPSKHPIIENLKLGSFPGSEPIEEESFLKSRIIMEDQSEEEQFLDEYQGERRIVRIYRDLLEIKKIDFYEEYQQYCLPQSYHLYAQKLSSLMVRMLNSVMVLVCSNKQERDIMRYTIKIVQAFPAILGRIGEAFKVSQDEPLLESLSKIIELRSFNETMLDLDNHDLKKEFFSNFNFNRMMNEISRYPNLSEASLQNYLKVLENYPLQQVKRKKEQCLMKLIQHYRKWGKVKELILAEIELLKLSQRQTADILLKQIAVDTAILLPEHALSICQILRDSLTRESILEILINNSEGATKIEYIKDRIISLYELGIKMRPRAITVFKGLQELVKGDSRKLKQVQQWFGSRIANPQEKQALSIVDIPKDQLDGVLNSLVEALTQTSS